MLRSFKYTVLKWLMKSYCIDAPRALPAEVKFIALWQFGGVGDMLLATPVLEALCEKYPDADIHLYCSNPEFASFLKAWPQLKEIHAFPIYDFDARTLMQSETRRQLQQIAEEMQTVRFDMVVNLHCPAQLDWWAVEWLLIKGMKPAYAMGFNPRFLEGRSLFDNWLNISEREGVHYTALYQKLLLQAGIEAGTVTGFPLTAQDEQGGQAILDRYELHLRPWVCIHVGGRRLKAENKMWSIGSFAELAGMLLERGVQPVLIGVDSERELGIQLCRAVPEVINVIGHTELGEMAYLIGAASAFIGHDSGPFHTAVACHTPAIAICGRPDAEAEYLNYDNPEAIVLKAGAPELIGVDDVYAAVEKVLPYD